MKKVSFILFFLIVILIGCDTTSIHTVSFNSMGGCEVADVTVKSGNPLSPPDVEREGYSLEGWYTSSDNGLTLDEKWIFIGFNVNDDLTLYAKWTINQYTITYAIVTEDINPLSYIILNLGETIIQVSLGDHHSSVLTSTGRLFMWGYNADGQLGDNTITDRLAPTEITSHFNLTEEESIIQVSLGNYHSSAITSTGRLFMWGRNINGQLGDNTVTCRRVPTEITNHFNLTAGETINQVSLGNAHSSALTSFGRLFMWGYNVGGQLGDNTTTDILAPTEITSHFNLTEEETIIQVSLGGFHSSALTSTGRLFMWGWNYTGQLGDNTTIDRLVPTEITNRFNLTADETIIQVSLASVYSSALTSTGRLYMWGWNYTGQLGDNTTTHRFVPTEITSHFSLASGETIIQVSFGWSHSSALTSTGRLFMWGFNFYGQLGDNTTTDRLAPTEITSHFKLTEDETIIQVSLGGALGEGHSSALTSSGRLFMWGNNEFGQLGDNTTINTSVPTALYLQAFKTFETTIYDYNQDIIGLVPNMDGYTFDGWFSDMKLTTPYILTTMPANDIVLYGRWIQD